MWRRAAVRGRRLPVEKFVLYQELDGRGARRGVEVVIVGGGHFEQRPRRTPARSAGVEPAGMSAIFFARFFCRQARSAGGTPASAILAIVLININSTND